MFTNLDGWIFFPFKNFFFLQIFQEKSSFFAASWYKKSWIWVTVCSCKVKWIEEIWKRMTLEVSKTSTVKEIRKFLKFYLANFFFSKRESEKNQKDVFTFKKMYIFAKCEALWAWSFLALWPNTCSGLLVRDNTYDNARPNSFKTSHLFLLLWALHRWHCWNHKIRSFNHIWFILPLHLTTEISWKLLLASGCHLTLDAFSESIHFILRPWPLVVGRIFVFLKSGSYFWWSSNVLQ